MRLVNVWLDSPTSGPTLIKHQVLVSEQSLPPKNSAEWQRNRVERRGIENGISVCSRTKCVTLIFVMIQLTPRTGPFYTAAVSIVSQVLLSLAHAKEAIRTVCRENMELSLAAQPKVPQYWQPSHRTTFCMYYPYRHCRFWVVASVPCAACVGCRVLLAGPSLFMCALLRTSKSSSPRINLKSRSRSSFSR